MAYKGEDRNWWDMGLNPITGLRPDPHEDNSIAYKRYYQPEQNLFKKTQE
jgi:hypothetical protein